MKMNLISVIILTVNLILIRVEAAPAQNNDVIVRRDGLVVKNKAAEVSDTIDVLTKISDDFEKNYRSVSAVTDFSKVVVGMMDSLKDLELKGDEMMKKIDVQESHLSSLDQEIAAKEEYITVVNEKVKESETVFNEMKDKVKETESRKNEAEEQTRRNQNKIRAQEERLRRLVKDITTKVEYVNVVNDKIEEIELKVDGSSAALEVLENRRDVIESEMKEFESRSKVAQQQVKKFNLEMLEKEKVYRNTKNDIKKYSEELEKLKGEWSEYQTKVVEANNTLR